jgi:hypothetical protein
MTEIPKSEPHSGDEQPEGSDKIREIMARVPRIQKDQGESESKSGSGDSPADTGIDPTSLRGNAEAIRQHLESSPDALKDDDFLRLNVYFQEKFGNYLRILLDRLGDSDFLPVGFVIKLEELKYDFEQGKDSLTGRRLSESQIGSVGMIPALEGVAVRLIGKVFGGDFEKAVEQIREMIQEQLKSEISATQPSGAEAPPESKPKTPKPSPEIPKPNPEDVQAIVDIARSLISDESESKNDMFVRGEKEVGDDGFVSVSVPIDSVTGNGTRWRAELMIKDDGSEERKHVLVLRDGPVEVGGKSASPEEVKDLLSFLEAKIKQ